MKQYLLLLLLIIIGCQPEAKFALSGGSKYLPNLHKLESGLVWKYYVHHIDIETKTTTTDIKYKKIQLIKDNILEIEYYNAGYQMKYYSMVQVEDSLWKTSLEYNILSNGDTIHHKILENTSKNWEGHEALTIRSKNVNDRNLKIIDQQLQMIDSIDNTTPLKVFNTLRKIENTKDDHTQKYSMNISQTWKKDMGMVSLVSESKSMTYDWELVELMDLEEFEKRRNHGTNRVGYIDPSNSMDNNSDFKTCDRIENIADYYNGEIARFKGGKGSLNAYLNNKLDRSKLYNESGYLTYRFVINCEGVAGRFITEQADLNYQKKTFRKDCVDHLFTLLHNVKEWEQLYIRDGARDAYVYITFKLKNGKIIEILP